jgi:hypothetical protein
MVSSEGACAAYYNYGRFTKHDTVPVQLTTPAKTPQPA